jgi:hypothetical protein
MPVDQQPKLRDDRYLLEVVLPRWQFDSFEITEQTHGALIQCQVEWTWEGLTCGVHIHLNENLVARDPKARGTNVNLAAPYWTAPKLEVPDRNGSLAALWPFVRSDVGVKLVPEVDGPGPEDSVRKASFELFSRDVLYLPHGKFSPPHGQGLIRLGKRIGFDRGLRNAITHAAGKLRTKGGATW